MKPSTRAVPLMGLRPGFFEFTDTRGILRVLRPKESILRAKGLVFSCPRCSYSKEKAHFNIFIFDFVDTPPELRPHGRFTPKMLRLEGTDSYVPAPFHLLTLQNLDISPEVEEGLLVPGDVKCGWKGTLQNGVVTWKLNLMERWRS